MRTPLVAGNWKMNLDHLEAITLVQKLSFSLPKSVFESVEVALFPPFTDIRSVQTLVAGEKLGFHYGAQDISEHDSGAYTGEISGAFLNKLECKYALVGHSERRIYHQEDNALVSRKIKAAFKHNITPILCVGEGEEIRNSGQHVDFTTDQLLQSLGDLSPAQVKSTVIAYEPVWAIGTGNVAKTQDAEEMASAIRETVSEKYGSETAQQIRILYGGSVNSKNFGEIIDSENIDGGLVGGASLKAEEFANLVKLAL